MRLFECQRCGQLLDFENTWCESCGLSLGYLPEHRTLSALEPGPSGSWIPLAAPTTPQRFCANNAWGVCNWLAPLRDASPFCLACRLNRTIPDLSDQRRVQLWQRIEFAKHRLVDGLLSLGLPLASWTDMAGGIAFDFLAPSNGSGATERARSGHRGGVITIDLGEADDAFREVSRTGLAEAYRTLLGHLRHEVGHYYWSQLVAGSRWHSRFRELFGAETQDYEAALQRHYRDGPVPSGWNEEFISAYASSHPWEDWAETWAHYLHMLDTLDTAYSFGLSLSPRHGRDPGLAVMQNLDPYGPVDFDALVGRWLPLIYAGNRLTRSLGQGDMYPFVLTPTVLGKLGFVHEVVRTSRTRYRGEPTTM